MAPVKSGKSKAEKNVSETMKLINDFEEKKRIFESTINQLKEFNPSLNKSPNVAGNSRFTRQQLVNVTPNEKMSTPSNNLESFSIEQLRFLFQVNQSLLKTVQNLQEECLELRKETKLLNNENSNLKDRYSELEKRVKDVYESEQSLEKSKESSVDVNKLIQIEKKVESLEQGYESNSIILQGKKIEYIIKNTESDQMKEILSRELSKFLDDTNNDVVEAITSVRVFGREKNIAKLEMKSNEMKVKLLTKIKRQKPVDIYISEFLVASRLKLFHRTRYLTKDFREKIDWVYTRNGNIFYRERDSKKSFLIRDDNDFEKLKLMLQPQQSD